jgi:hypothetical protein
MRNPLHPRGLTLAASCLLISCGEAAPRFAPLPDDSFKPPERELVGEDTSGEDSAVGPLPKPLPPALRCLMVGLDGRTELPPAGPTRPLGAYQDDLVCQVRLPAPGATGGHYERLEVALKARGARLPVAEIPLVAGFDGVADHLVWIPAKIWREAARGQETLTVEATARCPPGAPEDPEAECDLTLIRALPVEEVAAALPPDQKKPEGKGPQVTELRCAPYDPWGRPAAPLYDGKQLPLGDLRCALTVENPGDLPLEGVVCEIRAGAYRAYTKRAAARALPTLLPRGRFTLQLHVPDPRPAAGPFVLVAAAGRNSSERQKSERALSLKLTPAASPEPPPEPEPASQPATAPAAPEPEPTD